MKKFAPQPPTEGTMDKQMDIELDCVEAQRTKSLDTREHGDGRLERYLEWDHDSTLFFRGTLEL